MNRLVGLAALRFFATLFAGPQLQPARWSITLPDRDLATATTQAL